MPSLSQLFEPEPLRQLRATFAAGWLLVTVLGGSEVAPVAVYTIVACELIVAARWSRTVAQSALSTVLLFDLPVALVTLQDGLSIETAVLAACVLAMAALIVLRLHPRSR